MTVINRTEAGFLALVLADLGDANEIRAYQAVLALHAVHAVPVGYGVSDLARDMARVGVEPRKVNVGRHGLRVYTRADLQAAADRQAAQPAAPELWDLAQMVAVWLDGHNGSTAHERTLRILKVGEEYGEAIAAWIAFNGQNPRKTSTPDLDEVAAELCDVIIAAAVALVSTTTAHDARTHLETRLRTVLDRTNSSHPNTH